MSLRRFLSTNRKTDAARSSLENDRPPAYTPNVTDGVDGLNEMRALSGSDSVTVPTHTDGANSLNDRTRALSLAGSDSVTLTLPDETVTNSSFTDTPGVADTSEKATPSPRYSKRLSGIFKFSPPLLICVNFVSILPDIC